MVIDEAEIIIHFIENNNYFHLTHDGIRINKKIYTGFAEEHIESKKYKAWRLSGEASEALIVTF